MKKIGTIVICAGLCTVLVLDARGISAAVLSGVELCLNSIIPSLFAFLVLSSFVVESGIIKGEVPIFVLSMLGGYPVGAKLLCDHVRTSPDRKVRAEHMLMYCYCGSPAFLLMLSSAGLQIWLSNVIACAAVAVFANIPYFIKAKKVSKTRTIPDSPKFQKTRASSDIFV
ncbi:MAG: hypothetical protein FWF82_07415, partial [Oscillospiraceae bacterium]|nr:hypothetical protein [Oscillospiraceae bacterium]